LGLGWRGCQTVEATADLKVAVVMGFDYDVLSPKTGELAIEFVRVLVLLEVKAWYKVVVYLVVVAALVDMFCVLIKETESSNEVVVGGAEGGEEV
jgi:hypothetical protein